MLRPNRVKNLLPAERRWDLANDSGSRQGKTVTAKQPVCGVGERLVVTPEPAWQPASGATDLQLLNHPFLAPPSLRHPLALDDAAVPL